MPATSVQSPTRSVARLATSTFAVEDYVLSSDSIILDSFRFEYAFLDWRIETVFVARPSSVCSSQMGSISRVRVIPSLECPGTMLF